MIAIILAGGEGTRLYPLTKLIPKPMIKVGNKSLIYWSLECLPPQVTKIIIVVRYLSNIIKSEVGNFWAGIEIHYAHQQEDFKGTMGAIFTCKDFIDENFMVISADNIYQQSDMAKLIEVPNSILFYKVLPNDNPSIFTKKYKSILQDYIIQENLEPSFAINTGCYFFHKNFIYANLVEESGEFGMPLSIIEFINSGNTFTPVYTSFWIPVGTHVEYEYATKHFQNHTGLKYE